MARKGRILIDGGVYHIIARGHNRCKLFNLVCDYENYKNLIRDYKKEFAFYIFHYCLMSNHVHMLLKVSRGSELPYIMQGINQSYANYYKRVHSLSGNLFQGRYKSLIINKDEYLLECGRYIERNPLRANIVKDLSKYRFSSFNFYAEGAKDDIITIDPLYAGLSHDQKERMKLYKDYLLQDRVYERIVDERLKL